MKIQGLHLAQISPTGKFLRKTLLDTHEPKDSCFFKIWPSVELTKIHIVMHNFIITFDMNDTRVDFFIFHPGNPFIFITKSQAQVHYKTSF